MLDLAKTPDDPPTGPPVPNKRRTTKVSRPTVKTPKAVQTGPPKNKCQGCVHGDLLEMMLMEPSHIKHYLREKELLEFAACSGDCKRMIKDIHLAAPKAPIYFCDETNKGFYAPDDDPTKQDLECGLILCSPCHAIRQERYEAENATKTGSGNRRTSRRSTNNK